MTLSLRASILIFGLGAGFASSSARAEAPRPEVVQVSLPQDGALALASQESARGLSRRIERLLPSMLNSLAAARREHEPELVRCFDRAVSELHSLRRQVAYHAERSVRAREPAEQQRHQRALGYLAERVEALAHSGETCFTDGVLLPPGKTQVEVVVGGR